MRAQQRECILPLSKMGNSLTLRKSSLQVGSADGTTEFRGKKSWAKDLPPGRLVEYDPHAGSPSTEIHRTHRCMVCLIYPMKRAVPSLVSFFSLVYSLNAMEPSILYVSKPLLATKLETISNANTRVEMKQTNLAPSEKSGQFTTTCPVLAYVAKGTITFQAEGGEKRTIREGESFLQPKNTRILHLDNSSEAAQATVVGFYLLDSSDREAAQIFES
jgi:quercetin dioxygenase-like cupin family protein